MEMTPADLLPLAVLVPYSIVMGRALLWQFTKLAGEDQLLGTAAWVLSIALAWVLSVLVSLGTGLLWVGP